MLEIPSRGGARNPSPADDDEDPPTRIDLAWATALGSLDDAASDDSDAATTRYVDVLLAEPLFCPVQDDDEDGDEGGAAPALLPGGLATVRPILSPHEGRPCLTLFDSESRLAAFVDRPTSFVALAGRAFFRLARSADLPISLNPRVAPSASVFGVETVAAIALLADASEEEIELGGAEGAVVVAPPLAPGAPLLRALTARLMADGRIAEAWLVAVADAGETPPRFAPALCLRPRAVRADLRALAAEVSRLASSFEDGEAPLDVAVLDEGDQLLAAARRRGLGLTLEP